MNGLVFANRPEQGKQSPEQALIDSGSYWPQIDLSDLRQVMRIDNNISSERLYHSAAEAVAHVNGQLKSHRLSALQAAVTRLADSSDEHINGQAVQEIRYRRAVYSYTKALLLEQYADTDATGKTGTRAEAKQEQAEDYRRDGHFAVADILGRRRCDAALI